MPVRVQHLMWGDEKWLPEWLKKGNLTKEQLLDSIKTHIMVVGKRYKGKVREYTVVNDAFSRKTGANGNHDWWGEHIGEEYIDNAFIWAHQADPNAILILNDYSNETDGEISNLEYNYAKSAIARGIPICPIRMQLQLGGDNHPSKQRVVQIVNRFGELGLNV